MSNPQSGETLSRLAGDADLLRLIQVLPKRSNTSSQKRLLLQISYKFSVFQGSANNVTGAELIELGDEVMEEINTGQKRQINNI